MAGVFSSQRVRRASTLAVALVSASSVALAAPCDIYWSGNTPCVAAHSTTRSLYDANNYALYQVKRASDGATKDIMPLSTGGVANAASQDSFCANTTCVITTIYDQAGHGNHLTAAPPGSAASGPGPNGYDDVASAIGAPVTLNGQKAYGVFISPHVGYRNNKASGTALGDGPQGIYAVFDGRHYNTACCFDYGNAETSSTDTGNGHMEAVYFGTGDGWSGTGSGSGPWIMADLENYLFSGGNHGQNNNPTIPWTFVVAAVKGEANHWAIRGGDGSFGQMSSYYDGVRPDGGYNPMNKEGAIILGIGGDNSNGGQGTFYEGVMVSGYPSDDTENKVQANVIAQKYVTGNYNTGMKLAKGDSVSFQTSGASVSQRDSATTYLTHTDASVHTKAVTLSGKDSSQEETSWIVHTGLGLSDCYSFESAQTPGSFLRHLNSTLQVHENDGTKQFREDATFCTEQGFDGQGLSLRSWNYPTRYVRHFNGQGYVASNGGPKEFDNQEAFHSDVSWIVKTA